jgi:hypothetical protein
MCPEIFKYLEREKWSGKFQPKLVDLLDDQVVNIKYNAGKSLLAINRNCMQEEGRWEGWGGRKGREGEGRGKGREGGGEGREGRGGREGLRKNFPNLFLQ